MTTIDELEAILNRPNLSRGEAATLHLALALLGTKSRWFMPKDQYNWLPTKIVCEFLDDRLHLKTFGWNRED